MFADVNGIRLYYESQGDGRPVVLVHGLGSSSDMWRYQVPALASAIASSRLTREATVNRVSRPVPMTWRCTSRRSRI